MRKWIRDRFGRGKKQADSAESSQQQEASPPAAEHSQSRRAERAEPSAPEPVHEPPSREVTPSAAESAAAAPITGQPSGRVGQRARSRRRGGRGRRGRGGLGGERPAGAAKAPSQPPTQEEPPPASALLPGESRAGRGGNQPGQKPQGQGRGEQRQGREGGRREGGRPPGSMSRREREREREARRERGRVPHTGPTPLMPIYPDIAPHAPPPATEPTGEQEPEAAVVREAPAPEAPAARREGKPRGVVVLAVGLPGSGKTSWFRRRGVTPLSSDMVRHLLFDDATEQKHQNLVFSTLRSMLRARMIVGMPTNYVDATNLSPNERRQWIKMAESFGYEVHGVFFDVPLELCIERNRKRNRNVPDEAMQRMAEKLRPPQFDEGFAKIVVVRVKKSEKGSE